MLQMRKINRIRSNLIVVCCGASALLLFRSNLTPFSDQSRNDNVDISSVRTPSQDTAVRALFRSNLTSLSDLTSHEVNASSELTPGQAEDVRRAPLSAAVLLDEGPSDAKQFRKISGLRVIVTGMEKSGTTILHQLLLNAPCMMGALESGFLMGATPAEFRYVRPFYDWTKQSGKAGWYGLTNDMRDYITSAPCFAEMYARVRRQSPLMTSLAEQCPRQSELVDKTPGYIYKLPRVMAQAPGVPVVVIVKDRYSHRQSYMRGHKNPNNPQGIKTHNNIYDRGIKALGVAKSLYPDRIKVVQYETLIERPNEVMKDVYDFVGLDWDPRYLNMEALNKKGDWHFKPLRVIVNATLVKRS
jgi:hypothetical protein